MKLSRLLLLSFFIPVLLFAEVQVSILETENPRSEVSVGIKGNKNALPSRDPYAFECNGVVPGGTGVWTEGGTWTFYFSSELPQGSSCKASLQKQFTAELGEPIAKKDFILSIPSAPNTCAAVGPQVQRIIPEPNEGSTTYVKENQSFLLRFDCAVDEASLAKEFAISVEGLAESIPVKVIAGAAREKILEEYKVSGEPGFYVVQAARPLPPRAEITFTIGKVIASPSKKSHTAESFAYTVRPRFEIETRCEHAFADGRCDPFLPVYVVFTTKPQNYYDADYNQLYLKGVNGERWVGEELKDFPIEPGLWGTALKFKPPFLNEATYTFSVPEAYKDVEGRIYTGARELTIKTGPIPPMVRFAGAFGLLERSAGAGLPFTVRNLEPNIAMGSKQSDSIVIQALKVQNAAEIMSWLSRVQKSYTSNDGVIRSEPLLTASTPDIKQQVIKRAHGEAAFEVMGLPFNTPGFYVVEAASERYSALEDSETTLPTQVTSVLVTDLGVHTKFFGNSLLTWVTNLKTGASESDAVIDVYDCRGQLRGHGTTAIDGVGTITISPAMQQKDEQGSPVACDLGYLDYELAPGINGVEIGREPLLVRVSKGDDSSFTLSSWNKGLEAWRFNIGSYYYDSIDDSKTPSPTFVAKSVLPRNLLRRGETAHFKHIIREKTLNGLALLQAKPLNISMKLRHNGSGDDIELPASFENGGVSLSEWNIPLGAKLGDYTISVALEHASNAKQNLYSGSFSVLDYKVPLIKGSISRVQAPHNVPVVDTSLAYLAGGAASGQTVQLRYRYEPYDEEAPAKFADFDFINRTPFTAQDGDDEGEYREPDSELPPALSGVRSQTKNLDKAGAARFELTDLGLTSRPVYLRTELDFRDDLGERQTISRRFLQLPHNLMLGMRRNSWLSKDGSLVFDVVALDGEALPQANIPITVKLLNKQLYAFRQRLVSGFYSYEEAEDIKDVGTICKGVTDATGLLRCNVSSLQSELKHGAEYMVTAEAFTLPNGGVKDLRASYTTYFSTVLGDVWYAQDNSDRFDLIAERSNYEVGENAQLQARLPFREANVLFTFERDGVLRHHVQNVQRAASVVSLPITLQDIPNVFISALAVRGRLNDALPNAVFDPGKPALKAGYTELKVGRKPLTIETSVTTDKKRYKPREEVKALVQVQNIKEGEVALAVIDAGLLELKENNTWDLINAIVEPAYGPGVHTATNQLLIIGKRHFGLKALPFGGGGGKGLVRELFDTLIYWNPKIPLLDGKAQVSFALNDSITSFKVVAVTTSGSSYFGMGSTTIESSKDVVLESAIPAIVRADDSLVLEGTLRNTTANDLAAAVSGTFGENQLKQQPVTLAAGASTVLAWQVDVPDTYGKLDVSLQASANGITLDSVKRRTETHPAVPLQTVSSELVLFSKLEGASGAGKQVTIERALPEGARDSTGGISIYLSNSFDAPKLVIQDYMRDYAFSCLEQRVSKATSLSSNELWNTILAELPSYIDSRGLAKFFKTQTSGDVELTSYILSVSSATKQSLPSDIQSRMVEALKKFVRGSAMVFERQKYSEQEYFKKRWQALAALAAVGAPESTVASTLLSTQPTVPTTVLVDMFVTSILDQTVTDAKRLEIFKALQQRMKQRGAGLVLDFQSEPFSILSSDAASAKLLWHLTQLPKSKISEATTLQKFASGLASRVTKSGLQGTTANAWGVLAFSASSAPVNGKTILTSQGTVHEIDWSKESAYAAKYDFAPEVLEVRHEGQGEPLLFVKKQASVAVTQPIASGVTLKKGTLQSEAAIGDVLEISITMDLDTEQRWLVLEDAMIPGAVALDSSLSRSSTMLNDAPTSSVMPEFVESGAGVHRVYFSYLPKGTSEYRYRLRINTAGTFKLPPTAMQAMYAPDAIYGVIPNGTMVVRSQ